MSRLNIKKGETFNADIYIAGDLTVIKHVCREFTDIGGCVSVTPTEFIYTGGSETGAKIGFINYQRFPAEPNAITTMALRLARKLIKRCHQKSASVVTTSLTYYISDVWKDTD